MTRDQARAIVAKLPDLRTSTIQAMVDRELSKLNPRNSLAKMEISEVLWAMASEAMVARMKGRTVQDEGKPDEIDIIED